MQISSQIQKPARSQNVNGVRDARELLSEKRTHETHVPVTEYVKSLKEQIRSSEINARKIFKELQSTKKDLMTYLKESGDSGGDNYRLKECSRDNRERRSEKKRLDDQPPHKSRESSKNRQKSPERKRSRTHGKSTSPGCESRRSSSSPDRGSEHPDHWNILSPSQVDVSHRKISQRFFIYHILLCLTSVIVFSLLQCYLRVKDEIIKSSTTISRHSSRLKF